MKQRTKKKHLVLIDEFEKMIRSGVDYTMEYMYEQSADKVYMESRSAANVIREHYKAKITDDMKMCMIQSDGNPYKERVIEFAEKFNLCLREARYIMRFV